MGLIDIYGNAPRSFIREGLDGYDRAMTANDALRQRRAQAEQQKREADQRKRDQSFRQALDVHSRNFDLTTPEGQVGLMQTLARGGFGREAMELQKGYFDPGSREKQAQYGRDASFRDMMGQNSPYGQPGQMGQPGGQQGQGAAPQPPPMPSAPGGPMQPQGQPMAPRMPSGPIQGIPAGDQLPNQGVGGTDSTRLMKEATDRFLAGQQQPQQPAQGMDDDRLAWEAVRLGQMSVGDYLQNKRLRETKPKEKEVDPFDDPAKYQAYLQVAQSDPEFQAINRELATNRAKAGPKLTQWAIKNGYAGQKWWDREFGNLTKEAEKGPDRAAVSAAQNVHTNIRNARKDFEDNDFVKMIPKTDRYFQSASKAFADYEAAPENMKGSKRQFMDQALVYSFNKLMEETSAVMPGEFERTALGQSVPDAVINKIRSGLGGGLKLDDGQRRAMLNTMKIFRDGVLENARPVYTQFEGEARLLSPENPDRILGGYKKYFVTPPTPGKKAVTEADIDNMTKEQLETWLKENP